MQPDLETEFKLRARGPVTVAAIDQVVAASGLTCRSADRIEQSDVYLDDAQRSLTQAGRALRIRRNRFGSLVGCKCRGEQTDGLHRREEIEAPIQDPDTIVTAASLPLGVRDAVEPFVLDRGLLPIATLRVVRHLRDLEHAGEPLAELAFDEVLVDGHGDRPRFGEVEIEVRGDGLARCGALAAALGAALPLQPAADDKLSHALALLGEAGPAGSPAPAARTLLGERLARQVQALAEAEVGFRRDGDAAALHALRVAVRRLRVLVRRFPARWPEGQAEALGADLAELGRRVGPLRDLDVMLAALPGTREQLPAGLREPLQWLHTWLQDRRSLDLEATLDWLRGPERLGAAGRIAAAIATADAVAIERADEAAAIDRCLRRAGRAVRRLGGSFTRESASTVAHPLRLAVKRLRYLAEEFAPDDDRRFARALRHVIRLQQRLGDLCDHERATAWHLQWIAQLPAAAPRETLAAAIGGAATLHAQAAERAVRTARRCLARTDRRRIWRALRLR